jgi:ABC-type Fe3+/spermidine/putrescine transport system ATPase subunit
MNTSKPLLEIRELTKQYGTFQALSGISFDMHEGEIISVLGPSGCGKSTLLQLVAGLAQPDGGEIKLNGETIASQKRMVPPEKRGVNMVFQDYALWPHMNVFDNISYGLKQQRMTRDATLNRVMELVHMLHLDGLEKRLPPQLSGGQQQRVAIARALATRPRLMLLDEPLSNLDMRLRIEMRTEMAYLFRQLGMSVFHVTHDPDEAFAMADRLLILRNGTIDQIGTPQHCFTRPASRWAASLLGAINHVKGEVVRTASGVALRIGSIVIEGTVGVRDLSLTDGSQAEILFRPEDMIITSQLSAAEAAASEDLVQYSGVHNELVMKVKYCTFEGKRWRSIVELVDGTSLYLLSEQPIKPHSVLRAILPKEHAYLYSIEED